MAVYDGLLKSLLIPLSPNFPDLNPAVNLLLQFESRRQGCLKMDWFAGDGVVEV